MRSAADRGCGTHAAVPRSDQPASDEISRLEPVFQAHARRAVRDPEVARELVQETLLSAVEGRAPFAHRASLRSWLVGILAHKIVDHFRRNQRARSTIDEEA